MKLIKQVLAWLYNLLWILVHPAYWIQNYGSSKYLDAWYQEGLDLGETFTIIDECHAEFRGKRVWIQNHPYASFTVKGCADIMPSRRMRVTLKVHLVRTQLNK